MGSSGTPPWNSFAAFVPSALFLCTSLQHFFTLTFSSFPYTLYIDPCIVNGLFTVDMQTIFYETERKRIHAGNASNVGSDAALGGRLRRRNRAMAQTGLAPHTQGAHGSGTPTPFFDESGFMLQPVPHRTVPHRTWGAVGPNARLAIMGSPRSTFSSRGINRLCLFETFQSTEGRGIQCIPDHMYVLLR